MIDKNLIDQNWKEHYVKKGDPKKPTYYIIRRQHEHTGLFARYKIIGEHIRYALTNGWLPVIDMQNYPNPYLAPDKFGKENSWEYYFEQPLRIGLEQAYNGKNIILSAEEVLPQLYETVALLENRDNSLTQWQMLVKFGLLKVKPALMKEILAVRDKLFSANDRVLGVLLRGTDYVDKKPFGHPIPPPVEFAISTIIVKMKEWNCNKVFLATEDREILNNFKNIFGDLCITFDREYPEYKNGQMISLCRIDRPNDHFLQGKDYLTQIVLLSQCNSFITARCSGAIGAVMMAEHFEHVLAFNLGRYGMISVD